MTALVSVLAYLQEAAVDPTPREVRICTDSQSALGRLKEGPAAQRDALADSIWWRLHELTDRRTRLTLQWVPGHAGLPGNELADGVARAAADLDQDRAPVDLQSARSRLRRHAHREWVEHVQPTRYFREVGPRRATPGERLGLSRRDSVETSRLRTGHSTLLAGYRHRIGQQNSPTCPECEEGEGTLTHLLNDCPARVRLRRRFYGRDDPAIQDALGDRARLVELLGRLGHLKAPPRMVRPRAGNTATTTTTCPMFLKHSCLGISKHDRAQAGKISCMDPYVNAPGNTIIMVTTLPSSK